MQLRADLRDKIETLLSGERKSLIEAAESVSLKYRRESGHDLQIASEAEALAYIATRLPATFGAVTKTLQQFRETSPDFTPDSILDLGAGPGTATLAALDIWPDAKPTLLEPNPHLRSAGQKLVEANWLNAKIQNLPDLEKHDLVIASYVFNEIDGDLNQFFEKIWDVTSGAFVMIEPGTPHGYQTILKARDFFRGKGVNIAAPCPHTLECPLKGTDRWCHFSARIERSRAHLQIKSGSTLSYEDEKFSCLVASRAPVLTPEFRTLGHPHGQKVVRLEACNVDGTFGIREYSKKSPDYKKIRKFDWGDALFNPR